MPAPNGAAVRAATLADAEAICGIYNAVVERCGFSSVGLHRRHGQLDGAWRDVLVVERLLDQD